MAKVKTTNESIAQLDAAALHKELIEAQDTLQKSRVDVAFGRLKDTSKINKLRKQVARIQTMLATKEANHA